MILPICLSDTKNDGHLMSLCSVSNYQCKSAPLSEFRWWVHGIWAPLDGQALGIRTGFEGL